jgi:hypothetical protein
MYIAKSLSMFHGVVFPPSLWRHSTVVYLKMETGRSFRTLVTGNQ